MVTTTDREVQLRELIERKPKNGRAIAELSSLLLTQSKSADPAEAKDLQTEAIRLAQISISVAHTKPFGHVAMSCASRDSSERLASLDRAIDLTTDHFRIARAGLLLRTLTEPRDDEARAVKGSIGKASVKHPNRKSLTKKEHEVYERLKDELEVIHESFHGLSEREKELVSKQEFRLGQFFRKKEPRKESSERSRRHFLNCQHYPMASDYEMAGFWLATLGNDGPDGTTERARPPLRCPTDYVVGLYSTFAADFDKLLVEKLNYQTPGKIRKLFDHELANDRTRAKFSRCCDLGCGTGLSGLAFQSAVTSLVGIDLSPQMLDQARSRKCYEELHIGSIDTALQKIVETPGYDRNPFDLVLACDVFCYIGDLEDVFRVVHSALSSDGYFCFSVELLEERNAEGRSFQLHESARFCHTEAYVTELAKEHSFEISQLEMSDIRKNQGKEVNGLLVVLKKVETK